MATLCSITITSGGRKRGGNLIRSISIRYSLHKCMCFRTSLPRECDKMFCGLLVIWRCGLTHLKPQTSWFQATGQMFDGSGVTPQIDTESGKSTSHAAHATTDEQQLCRTAAWLPTFRQICQRPQYEHDPLPPQQHRRFRTISPEWPTYATRALESNNMFLPRVSFKALTSWLRNGF